MAVYMDSRYRMYARPYLAARGTILCIFSPLDWPIYCFALIANVALFSNLHHLKPQVCHEGGLLILLLLNVVTILSLFWEIIGMGKGGVRKQHFKFKWCNRSRNEMLAVNWYFTRSNRFNDNINSRVTPPKPLEFPKVSSKFRLWVVPPEKMRNQRCHPEGWENKGCQRFESLVNDIYVIV